MPFKTLAPILATEDKDRAEVVYAPEDFEYGAREFGIRDDSGYALAFGAASRTS